MERSEGATRDALRVTRTESLQLDKAAAAVLHETWSTIESLHARRIAYADVFSPLHDDGLRDVLRRLTIYARGESLGSQDVEAVAPPAYHGRYVLLYSTDIDDRRRAFAVRHGMGHVAAGHVSEISYMSNRQDRDDFMRHEERVADLFALADLIAFWRLDELRKQRLGWRAVSHEVCRVIRQHTLDWPEARVHDRARLRIALYRHNAM